MTPSHVTDTVQPNSADSYTHRLSEAEAQFAEWQYDAALQSLAGLEALDGFSSRDKVRLYTLLANCHARLEQPAASLRYALQTLQHSQALDDATRAEAHYQVGRGYGMMNAETNALDHLLAAHRLYGYDNSKILNGVANCHYLLEEYAQAAVFYRKSCEVARRQGKVSEEIRATVNLSQAHLYLGNLAEAAEVRWSADLAMRKGLLQQYYACLCQLVHVYTEQGRLEEAWRCLAEAAELEGRNGLVKIPFSETYYGKFYLRAFQLECAEAHLLTAIELTINYPEDLILTHKLLAELYELQDDYGRALKHHKEAHALEVRRLKSAFSSRSAALAIELEVERIRQEQEFYKLKNLELTRAVEGLEELSQRDGLTGLYNRRFLDERLSRALEAAHLLGQSLTVLIIDIDDFKWINDTLSHAVGDTVLKRVATLFKATLRAGDLAARYGGEEFVIILPNTSGTTGSRVAEKIRDAVTEHTWAEVAPGLKVTVSIGLADSRSGLGAENLLAQADAKLYEAKRTGKNRVAV